MNSSIEEKAFIVGLIRLLEDTQQGDRVIKYFEKAIEGKDLSGTEKESLYQLCALIYHTRTKKELPVAVS